MAMSPGDIWEVRPGGSDTANGGGFSPGQTGNTNGAVSSANTSAPVITSATYNFVSGDVGAWLFLKSGSNGIPGWYKIVSVASNAATLDATAGNGYLYVAADNTPVTPTTATGCGTASSLTNQTWMVDYSQQDAYQFAVTGMSTASSSNTISCASAAQNWKGNLIQITGGTNFVAGIYDITGVTTGVSFVVAGAATATSAAGASGTGNIGGGLASMGKAGSKWVNGQVMFIKYDATPYSITASTAVAGGVMATNFTGQVCGYDTSRCMSNTDANRPTVQASGISSATLFPANGTAGSAAIRNIIMDGNNLTSIVGVNKVYLLYSKVINMTAAGSGVTAFYSEYNSNAALSGWGPAFVCSFDSNSVSPYTGLNNGTTIGCKFTNNTGIGATFQNAGFYMNNIAWNNTSHGFSQSSGAGRVFWNNISVANGGDGYNNVEGTSGDSWKNNVAYNNTGPDFATLKITGSGNASLTGDPFNNAAGGDFSLNNTAGAGTACRGTAFPSSLPPGTTPDYSDIGAAQHQDSGGGAGGANLLGEGTLVV